MSFPIDYDFEFFKEAVHVFSSSLIFPEVMRATFDFMNQHFPLEGISLHRFEPQYKAMHIFFLVTRENFHYLDSMIPFPEKAVHVVEKIERTVKVINVPHSEGNIVPTLHGKTIAPYLPHKDRARLVAILSTPKERAVGHLSLVGPGPNCFNDEHEHKLNILWPILGLFMMNLLQYHEIVGLKNLLADQNRYLTGTLRHLRQNMFVGEEGGLHTVKEMIRLLSGQDVPVLITGETGTGKELIADAIQRFSIRHKAPYIKVNCGAIPDTLIDSELFGHEKGAFTGADRPRYGRFEQADGGTLFLDEIGDMPLNVQVRLLRVLQDGIFERVGGSRSISVDVRIIAATHENLPALVDEGRFREDLYYRLNVFPIHVPPLREHTQDIPALIHHFIMKKAKQLQLSNIPLLSTETLPGLAAYSWPGNVRELENLVERALILDPKGPLNLHVHLPHDFVPPASPNNASKALSHFPSMDIDTDILSAEPIHSSSVLHRPESLEQTRRSMQTLDQITGEHIRRALILCNGKISGPGGAAKMLGINPNTLRKRMDKQGISYGRKGRS